MSSSRSKLREIEDCIENIAYYEKGIRANRARLLELGYKGSFA